MKNLLLILTLIISFSASSQYNNFGNINTSSLKFGCGNDLDLSFTGGMFVTAGIAVYYIPRMNYNSYSTSSSSFTPSQTQTLQNVAIGLLITGGIILIEESIRHGVHKARGYNKW